MATETTPHPTDAPGATEELIRFDKVVKRFGGSTVLDELDFSVAAGRHVTLIGPSGSGKTTILRLLMTLIRPDQGTISVDSSSGSPSRGRWRCARGCSCSTR
ncbi:hypothetical protein GCM10012280_31070 [Wenjunlia tyrosinilytica]|uniref:ABC transporter domain-containing protein n=1 Tax=Wenjunlia tyrosinilytica TaxID=1544741 RepID=A0A918DZ02_9ACTN|nr:hypothetical protein GCM10012280_31070 [Wenjunlia tyrosinilytica]